MACKVSPITPGQSLNAQRYGQMGLPDARRAHEDDILVVGDEPAHGKVLDLLTVDLGLEAEVEVYERLDERKLGHRHTDGEVLLLLGGNLPSHQLVEEVGIGHVLRVRFFQTRLELVVDPVKPQVLRVLLDAHEAH
jgi:hypothetical protein